MHNKHKTQLIFLPALNPHEFILHVISNPKTITPKKPPQDPKNFLFFITTPSSSVTFKYKESWLPASIQTVSKAVGMDGS